MEPPPLNPYQAPTTQHAPPALPPAQGESFREMKIFAWLAAACIASTFPYAVLIFLLMKQVVTLPMDVLELVDGLHAIIFILGVVFYCIWKYRCACNARYFYGGPLMYTPGWCVGYYFIPIMMLFRPYQCMKDIYEKTYLLLEKKPPNGLILLWWLSWIFNGIIERIAMKTDEVTVMSAAHTLSMLSALLVLWVIFTLTRRQYDIMLDPTLAAKVGTINPMNQSLPAHIPAVPMYRAQLPEGTSSSAKSHEGSSS
jgi:hypothetical protein